MSKATRQPLTPALSRPTGEGESSSALPPLDDEPSAPVARLEAVHWAPPTAEQCAELIAAMEAAAAVPDPNCNKCRHWRPNGGPAGLGECRRPAPSPALNLGTRATFPMTEPCDWCGEFGRKLPAVEVKDEG